MTRLALLAIAAILPGEEIVTDRVSIIELNHVHCRETGRELLSQVIYWCWWTDDQHHVAEWRMVSSAPHARFRREGREWVETRYDGPLRREIRAPQFRETWTLRDPEVADRESLPVSERLPLRRPLAKRGE